MSELGRTINKIEVNFLEDYFKNNQIFSKENYILLIII